MELRTTIEIDAEQQVVWDALADPQRWPEWMDDLTSVEPTNPGATPAYGTRYRVKKAWWRMDNQELEIRDIEPPDRLVVAVASAGAGSFSFEYLLRPTGDGKVAVEHVMRPVGMYGELSGWMTGASMDRKLAEEATRLRDFCEGRE